MQSRYENNGYAEIAQLVEHNLAKVGVASSSLVFRSKRGHLRMTFDFEKQHSTQHFYRKNTQQSTWRGTFKLNHICRSVTNVVGFFVVLFLKREFAL